MVNQSLKIDKDTVVSWEREWVEYYPNQILDRAVEYFGDGLVLACSFSPEDIVLIDLLNRGKSSSVKAFFLDTDFHFPETLVLKEKMLSLYPQLRLQVIKPLMSVAKQNSLYGDRLYERDADRCCGIRKVEPLNRVLQEYRAWVTGMRREQASTRAGIGVVQWDSKRQMVKFNPLATWTHRQVWNYIQEHQLPYNPLHDRGYPSIGCSPITCTAPVAEGADPRAGRWQGRGKQECGLHTDCVG